MGLYERSIFPWVLDHAMRRLPIQDQRPLALAEASGEVLEIGFGTGLNLPHYPSAVKRIVAVEPHEKLRKRAQPLIAASSRDVELVASRADALLPFEASRFDCAVSTWTFCTIPDVAATLKELHRVLKPGGRLLFVEHGLAPDEGVRRWQRRLNPLIRFLGAGCTLDRDIAGLVKASPFSIERCDTFYLPDTPRVGGHTFRGSAMKT